MYSTIAQKTKELPVQLSRAWNKVVSCRCFSVALCPCKKGSVQMHVRKQTSLSGTYK